MDDVIFVEEPGRLVAQQHNISITRVSMQELLIYNEAPQSVYQYILREVYYENNADEPGRVERTINFTINDGNFYSTAFTTVDVIPTNDPAFVNLTERALTFNEATRSPVNLFGQEDSLVDLDGDTLQWVTIEIVSPIDPNDVLVADVRGTGLTVNFNGSRLLNISGDGNFTQYEAVLSTVVYFNNFPGMDLADRVINVFTFDGMTVSFVQSVNVTILPFDDQPMCYFNTLVSVLHD